MKVTISLIECEVKNYNGKEMLSYTSNSPRIETGTHEVKNVKELESLVLNIKDSLKEETKQGHYRLVINVNDRKVRGFDNWRKTNEYLEI